MSRVVSLVAEKVSVCSGLKEPSVTLSGKFPDGKSDRAVRKTLPDSGDDICHPVFREPSVLAALEDKGAEAETVSVFAAGKNLIFGQSVADRVFIAFAYAAVIAVVPAVVGKFDQPPDIDVLSVVTDPGLSGAGEKIF